MLKSKEDLISFLNKKGEQIIFNDDNCERIRNYMLEKYNIPTGTTMDMLARSQYDEQTEFILFCLLDSIDVTFNTNHKETYYTKIEITQYLNEKIEIYKISFPIRIKCNQVTKDQWIGVANTKFFMELRRAQLINYNTNAQRVMKRIVKGTNTLFKMIPNKMAISAIKVLMKEHNYIPTPVTLNIPYDSDADFYYDEKAGELVIRSLDMFDISDGYHRYLAMCALHDSDNEFNYPMEIRIINFTDEKTRQFIFQEDQKTKMAQADSNTMNTNRPSNNVVDRLNEMSSFNFKGQIGRNEGTISYSLLSNIIEYFYFRSKKTYTTKDVINVTNEVKNKLNDFSNYEPDYIDKPLNVNELAVIFYVLHTEEDIEKACSIINRIINSEDIKTLKGSRGYTKPYFNSIANLVQKEG